MADPGVTADRGTEEPDSARVVRRLWGLFQARQWEEAGRLLAEDVVVEWPHSGERIQGRDNVIAVNRNYPEGWSINVRTIVADGDRVASEVEVPLPPVVSYGASFFVVRDGLIRHVREYWVDWESQEPPVWRAGWVERLSERSSDQDD